MNIESINPLDEFRLQMSRRHFFSPADWVLVQPRWQHY